MENKPTVLIIEDERDLSDLLKEGLEIKGISILQAFDGEEGLHIALEKKPYLIMLDIHMPKMDGIKFLKIIRDDVEYGSKARVIVLSNLADKDKMKEAADLGAIDYIIKSNWGIQEIADKITALVSSDAK